MHFVWNNTGVRIGAMIPEKLRVPAGALLTIAVILVGAFASEESADNTRANRAISLFGLVVFLFLLWATSRNRKLINWHTVIVGMLLQFIIAYVTLKLQAVAQALTLPTTASSSSAQAPATTSSASSPN